MNVVIGVIRTPHTHQKWMNDLFWPHEMLFHAHRTVHGAMGRLFFYNPFGPFSYCEGIALHDRKEGNEPLSGKG